MKLGDFLEKYEKLLSEGDFKTLRDDLKAILGKREEH